MARIRTASYDVQREQILAQAAMLFAQRGYASTSMNEVAHACKVSKPALYHYVKDKNELLASICEEHLARLKAVILEVQDQGLEAEASIRRMILRFVEEYADAQDEHRVLTEDVKYLSAADRARVLEGERFIVHAVAAALARLRPDLDVAGLVKPLTMLLFGMINWMFTWLKPGRPVSHAAMAPIVADLFFGGLGAVLAGQGDAAPSTHAAPGSGAGPDGGDGPSAGQGAPREGGSATPKGPAPRRPLGLDR
jgi:TetR/AcrR family transcriptional regulator